MKLFDLIPYALATLIVMIIIAEIMFQYNKIQTRKKFDAIQSNFETLFPKSEEIVAPSLKIPSFSKPRIKKHFKKKSKKKVQRKTR